MKYEFRGPVIGLSSNLLIVGILKYIKNVGFFPILTRGYTLIYFNMVAPPPPVLHLIRLFLRL